MINRCFITAALRVWLIAMAALAATTPADAQPTSVERFERQAQQIQRETLRQQAEGLTLEDRVLAAGLIEPELTIDRSDDIQQPTHPRRGDLQRRRLLDGRNLERQLVLAGRDPLSHNRLQHLHLSSGVSRAEVLDLPRPASRLPDHLDSDSPRRGPHRPHIGHQPTITDPRLVRNFEPAPERTT